MTRTFVRTASLDSSGRKPGGAESPLPGPAAPGGGGASRGELKPVAAEAAARLEAALASLRAG
jgi:hypothetical protein